MLARRPLRKLIKRKIFLEVLWKNELYKLMGWMLLLNTVYSEQI